MTPSLLVEGRFPFLQRGAAIRSLGEGWRKVKESNPPSPVRSFNGFEDRGGHQARITFRKELGTLVTGMQA